MVDEMDRPGQPKLFYPPHHHPKLLPSSYPFLGGYWSERRAGYVNGRRAPQKRFRVSVNESGEDCRLIRQVDVETR